MRGGGVDGFSGGILCSREFRFERNPRVPGFSRRLSRQWPERIPATERGEASSPGAHGCVRRAALGSRVSVCHRLANRELTGAPLGPGFAKPPMR